MNIPKLLVRVCLTVELNKSCLHKLVVLEEIWARVIQRWAMFNQPSVAQLNLPNFLRVYCKLSIAQLLQTSFKQKIALGQILTHC